MLVAIVAVQIYAQTSSGIPEPFNYFLQFGLVGVLVIGAATGFIFFRPQISDLREDKAKAEAQRDKMLETVLPILPAMAALKPLLEEMLYRLEQEARNAEFTPPRRSTKRTSG